MTDSLRDRERAEFSLSEAVEHLRRGAFEAAFEALERAPQSAGRYLLRARIAESAYEGRESARLVAAALEDGFRLELFSTPEQHALARAMSAWANEVLERPVQARRDTHLIGELADLRRSAVQEIVYYQARAYLEAGDGRAARSLLARRAPADPVWNARYLLLRAGSYGFERVHEQSASRLKALRVLRADAPGEHALIARAARELADHARDVRIAGALEELEHVLERIEWVSELQETRFRLLRAIGWQRALQGDYARGLQTLHHAKYTTVRPGYRALTHLDCATIAHWAGERVTFRAELGLAHDTVEGGFTWHSGIEAEAETIALIRCSELYALLDPPQAIAYFNEAEYRFGRLKDGLPAHEGQRYEAILLAAACTVFTESDRARAIADGRSAHRTLSRFGLGWRAGSLALHLHRLTGERAWLVSARTDLAGYERNALVEELQAREALPPLTRRQQEILHFVHAGLRDQDMAERLSLSANTIRTHVQVLHHAFGVKHRGELILKTAALLPLYTRVLEKEAGSQSASAKV